MNHVKLFEQYEDSIKSVYYPKLKVKTEDVFELTDYQDGFCNLYPGFDPESDADWTDEYYYSSKEDAYSEVNFKLEILESLPEDIEVFRTIHVKRLEDVDTDFLGSCWSHQKHSALEFGRHNGATVLMSGIVNYQDVDWWQTIRVHFQHSGTFDSDDENEINVDNPENIQNLKIEWIGK